MVGIEDKTDNRLSWRTQTAGGKTIKTIRNKYKDICDFGSLLAAHKKARRGKGNSDEVLRFEEDLTYNIESIRQALLSHKYRITKYRCFKIFEPKERDIMALAYRDRIVQHALCDNVLEPFLDKRLDFDNAACRKNKGTHFALNRLRKHMRNAYNKWGSDYFVLKCDVKRYFYSIRHDILKSLLFPYIEDEEIKWLLNLIIDSTEGNEGIPIGNMTSQWFAVFYLDTLDRFIRNELKIKFYSRYMDDFVLIDKDKQNLKECLCKIRKFLNENLGLELNNKTQIFPIKNGVDYLGFHSYITETGKVIRKIRKKSKAQMKRKIRKFNKSYNIGEIKLENIKQSVSSWIGHAKHGNTYHLRKNIVSRLRLIGGYKIENKEDDFDSGSFELSAVCIGDTERDAGGGKHKHR